ncbi:hypothetical protein [Roseiconus lacunae]|uniref:hypothetical protein n=1 Tax=Roseiconus lacunae TaxID=2605694 RepID=UPI001E2B1F0F|nr:hypothetical protein [Roseiconus lacunae]
MNRSDAEETRDGLGLDIGQEEVAVATTGLLGGVVDELVDHWLTCSTSQLISSDRGKYPSNTTVFRSIDETSATEPNLVPNWVWSASNSGLV